MRQVMVLLAGLGVFALASVRAGEFRERAFEITYQAVVKDVPRGAKSVELWLPVPQDNHVQRVWDVTVTAPARHRFTKDPEYGNRFVYVNVPNPTADTVTVVLKFKAKRQEVVNRPVPAARVAVASDPLLPRFLQADRLVPLNDRIRGLSAEVAGSAADPLEKARLIYNYVVANIKYDKSGQGWGRGDLLYVCDEKRGNCTDFHALAIGLARTQQIPAKFEIGLSIPTNAPEGKIAGYHCWAYFFIEKLGWVPIDASEAAKNPDKRDYFYGALDADRIAFTVGRDVQLVPAPKEQPKANFVIYPYAEVDGKTHTAVDRGFSYRDLK